MSVLDHDITNVCFGTNNSSIGITRTVCCSTPVLRAQLQTFSNAGVKPMFVSHS